jgi:hypothetical protein
VEGGRCWLGGGDPVFFYAWDRDALEKDALIPDPVDPQAFNPDADLPYGLTIEHVRLAMQDFLDFLGFINAELHARGIERQESLMMPAGFSGMVGEFMVSSVPKHCPTLAKNNYHNGHPDMLPAGRYPNNAAQHVTEGIEVKGSRYASGWQGHNPEDAWLMVFVYDSNRPVDSVKGVDPRPFRFVKVLGAQLAKSDWNFSGRTGGSRRTITASVNKSGMAKMRANVIYVAPDPAKLIP